MLLQRAISRHLSMIDADQYHSEGDARSEDSSVSEESGCSDPSRSQSGSQQSDIDSESDDEDDEEDEDDDEDEVSSSDDEEPKLVSPRPNKRARPDMDSPSILPPPAKRQRLH